MATRRERLKSALYLRLKKRKVFKISVGRFHEKLLFLKLRLLSTKMQYTSDITLKVRIQRFTPDITTGDFKKSNGTLGKQKRISKEKN